MNSTYARDWFIGSILILLFSMGGSGCGSRKPQGDATKPAPAAGGQPAGAVAAHGAAADNKVDSAADSAADSNAGVVKIDFLDPTRWSPRDFFFREVPGHMQRTPEGLRISCPTDSNGYVMLSHKLTDDFEVAMKLSIVAEDKPPKNPMDSKMPLMVVFHSSVNELEAGVIIPDSAQAKTLELKVRGSHGLVGLTVNGLAVGGLQRAHIPEGNFGFSFMSPRTFIVHEITLREGLEPDKELAQRASMMGPGMMGPPPGMMGPGMMDRA